MDAIVGEAEAGTVPWVTHPERVPSKRYYDPAFFELEREKLWPHVWQMACRLEQIPDVGDYIEYRILEKSVIVVRTKSGIKAYHNACRHRGVELVEGSGNCRTKGFICPFHGWRWNMEGENTFVFGKQIFSADNLAAADLALAPCRVELWGGCAFINFDDAAPSLLEHLGPAAERLDRRNVEKMRAEWWYSTVLPANWKLAMEAFMESYHVMRTHPQLHATMGAGAFGDDLGMAPARSMSGKEFVASFVRFSEVLRDGMAGQISERELEVIRGLHDLDVPDDLPGAAGLFMHHVRQGITDRSRAEGLAAVDLVDLATKEERILVEFLFPHFFMLPVFSVMASYRIRPLTPETCLFEIWSLDFFPEGEEPGPLEPTHLPYDSDRYPEIPRQDYANIPRQQRGLHAAGFDYMRLSDKYEGLISNYQRLIDGYLRGADGAALADANRIVNSGYDAPVLDLGL